MTELETMWDELAKHQPIADQKGYGAQWQSMCVIKTPRAAEDAANAAWEAERAAARDARAAGAAARAAFEDIERRQGGGFKAKQAMAADKLQEPVAWINAEKRTFEWNGPVLWETPTIAVLDKIPLYTAPPKRPWVGLTPEETSGFSSQEMTVLKYVSKVFNEKNA